MAWWATERLVKGGAYALIAARTGRMPIIFMTRVRLYASTCSAISLATRGSVFICPDQHGLGAQ